MKDPHEKGVANHSAPSFARYVARHAVKRKQGSKYPPAEPEALRLLAPQRGLIATDQNQNPRLATSGLIGKSGKGLGEADC